MSTGRCSLLHRAPYTGRGSLSADTGPPLGAAAGLAFVVLSGVNVWSFARHDSPGKPRPTDEGRIVLGDFANATGDPAFTGTLRQILAAQLGNSASMTLLPEARVTQTLRLMERPADAKLSPDVAAEVCERTASAAVVEGSVTSLGSEYLLGLRARTAAPEIFWPKSSARLPGRRMSSKRSAKWRTVAGLGRAESLPIVKKQPSLPDDATTSSRRRGGSYSAAMKSQQTRAQAAETVPLFKRAIEIDPQFAMAYAQFGRQYASLGESELGAQNIARAYELRKGVSDRENYEITFNYHRQVTRNLEVARQTLESWVQEYPGDFLPRGYLAAFTTQGSGRYEKAAEEGLKAIGLDPDYSIGYQNVIFAYIYLDRLSEAEAVLRKASERRIDTIELSTCRYFIAFLRSDQAAIEREITQRQAKFEAQGWFEHQQALTLAYQGRLKEAGQLSDRAVSLSRQSGLRERPALFEDARAVWSACSEFGRKD